METPLFGQIIGTIGRALAMLGADSFLQATVASWRDTQDDETTLAQLQEWTDHELDRIADVVQVFRKSGFWEPDKRYSLECRGCSQQEFPEIRLWKQQDRSCPTQGSESKPEVDAPTP